MTRAIILASLIATTAAGLLAGATPARADSISIGVHIGSPPPPPPPPQPVVVTGPPPPVVVTAPPQLVVVPGTPVYYAQGMTFDYFVYANRYYTHHDGAWFVARAHHGPWRFIAVEKVPQPVLAVPPAYHRIPPGHAKKHGHHHHHRHHHGKSKHKWKDD
jgi:hypothetical protein